MATPSETIATHPHVGRPLDPTRDDAILEACARLIARDGYDRVTVEQIAAEAGVGKATVYRRWSSKAAIAVHALAHFKAPLEPIDTGSLEGDLDALSTSICKPKSTEVAALVFGLATAMVRDHELRDAFEETHGVPRRARFERILAAARERGEIADHVDIEFVANVFPSLIQQQMLATGRPADEPYVRSIVEQILKPALGVTPRDAHRPDSNAPKGPAQ